MVTLETNAPEVTGILGRLFRDQIPFALSKGINDVALSAQTAQRQHQREIFKVRRATFVDRAVKIKPFASKARPQAIIRIDPPGGQARADILTKFEDQREKRAREGSLAVPVLAKRSSAGIIRSNERPRALNFRPHGTSGRVMRGERGTVLIRTPQGGVILQTFGRRGSRQSLVLYVLEREVPIEPNLQFVETVTRVVLRDFDGRFFVRFREAVRSAR